MDILIGIIIAVVIIVLMLGIYSMMVVGSRADDQAHQDFIMDNANRCVYCGEIIPEGRQVCPNCEQKIGSNEEIE